MRPPKGPWPDVPDQRRKTMAAIRGRDTKAELMVRRSLHAMGYRFRVNERRFGFRPDILFSARRKTIFIHGCFWHGHEHCPDFRMPASRTEWWTNKITGNKARDLRAEAALRSLGWHVVTIWGCALKNVAARSWLEKRLMRLLGTPLSMLKFPALPTGGGSRK